jgi:hypothetical protein
MKRIGSQTRETMAAAGEIFIKSLYHGNCIVTLNRDGKFSLWSMNDHYAGYVLVRDGVGYEFCRSLNGAALFAELENSKRETKGGQS